YHVCRFKLVFAPYLFQTVVLFYRNALGRIYYTTGRAGRAEAEFVASNPAHYIFCQFLPVLYSGGAYTGLTLATISPSYPAGSLPNSVHQRWVFLHCG